MAEQSTNCISRGHLITSLRHSLRAGGSLFAIGCLLASAAAHAQDQAEDAATEDAGDDAIVVTG